MGVCGQRQPRPLYPRERTGTIVYEARWASEPVWTGAENLAPTRIRSLDRRARNVVLYRLSFPGALRACTNFFGIIPPVFHICSSVADIVLSW